MSLNRREFLRNSSLAVLGAAVLSKFAQAQPLPWPPGLQLWTVGDLCQKDLPGTLQKVSAIGYKDVEFAGYYGHTPKQIVELLKENGLRSTSMHFSPADWTNWRAQWPQFASDIASMGIPYAVFPMFHPMLEAGQFAQGADTLNQLAQEAQKAGVKFAFHNHNYEFRAQGNETGFDYFLQHTDPKLVNFEMDCYWVVQAGHDPVHYLDTFPGRIALLHIKDRVPGFPTSTDLGKASLHTTSVGKGNINWVPIFKAAEKSGVKQYYVEQENNFLPSKFDSIKLSVDYLKQLQI
jgi:sugar phosphate isomerase/epimerase